MQEPLRILSAHDGPNDRNPEAALQKARQEAFTAISNLIKVASLLLATVCICWLAVLYLLKKDVRLTRSRLKDVSAKPAKVKPDRRKKREDAEEVKPIFIDPDTLENDSSGI